MGTFSSVVNFNNGFSDLLANAMYRLSFTPGKCFVESALVFDSKRVKFI